MTDRALDLGASLAANPLLGAVSPHERALALALALGREIAAGGHDLRELLRAVVASHGAARLARGRS